MEQKTLPELFFRVCQRYTSQTAYLYRPRFRTLSWTYQDLWNHAVSFAHILGQHNIQKGDRVVLIGFNSPFWVASFFGIQLRGAVAVPLSPESKPEFIQGIVRQTQAKCIFKNRTISTKGISIPIVFIEDIAKPSTPVHASLPALGEHDIAEIVYTSGTTGNPKGVILTHKNLLSSLAGSRKAIPVDHTMRFVSILPLFHMFEQLGGMLVPLAAGAQVSYAASLSPNHLSRIFQDDKPNRMLAVPEFLRLIYLRIRDQAEIKHKLRMLEVLLSISQAIPSMALRRLFFRNIHKKFGWNMHTIASGGAALSKEVGEFWESLGIYILQGYGLTETSPVLTVNSYQERTIASVGKPVQGVTLKLSGDGEILAKGPNIFAGYWRDEQKTKEIFDEKGWLRTGDIGFFDRKGYLHIRGRKKFMIVLPSGENVYPEDIEFELNKEHGVADSTVLGLKRNGEEQVHAVLLLKKDTEVNPQTIINKVNAKLMAYQRIQGFSVWSLDDFPRTPTRKVKKHEVLPVIEAEIQGKRKEELPSKTPSILQEIVAKVAEVPVQEVKDEKRLVADFNLDSLKRIELVARIESEFSVALDEAEITPQTTVRDIRETITEKKQKHILYPFNPRPFGSYTTFLRALFQIFFLKPLVLYVAPVEIKGLENIEHIKHPVLFFSNHLSTIDVGVIYGALPARIRKRLAVAAATEVLYETQTPWIKYAKGFLEFLFVMFPFSRSGQVKSSVEYLGRIIDRDFSVLVFPEGVMSRTGRLREFKGGAGLLAIEMGVPIVPVKLKGTQQVVQPGPEGAPPVFRWPRRHRVKITFGKPFLIDQTMTYQEAARFIEEKIRNL
ncbi:AMP-binding protein [Patescibacteria group bacterium]|nr:AMP-binding protein [Patescibacteria group bacterium]